MISGYFSDGESIQQQSAKLSLSENNTVALLLNNKEILVDDSDITISSRLGNSARYIQFAGIGKFETRDNDAVDELAQSLNKGTGILHSLESKIPLILLALLITLTMAWGTVKYGVPKAADVIVNSLPEKTGDHIEDIIVNRIEHELFEESALSKERQSELNDLFASVNQQLQITQGKYSFKIRKGNDDIGANALAFPNGMIIMTDQLVALATSDKQIAGVMAHELGHLDAKHSLRQLVRGSIFTFLIAFITGDVSGASSAVLSAPAFLAELQYSREFEADADDYALRYFDCDIQGLRDMGIFFLNLTKETETISIENEINTAADKPQKKPSPSDFLLTHPTFNERQLKLEQHIQQNCLD